MPSLPDFVLIGASRSGSTSLARYLGAHPEVFMAKEKEIRFFTQHFDKGLAWYALHFAKAEPGQVKGEATPAYMFDRRAMARLVETLPAAWLIATLRNPTDRAWSDYWMVRRRGREHREFGEIVDGEIDRISSGTIGDEDRYVLNGLYDIHMSNLLTLVDRRQLHVLCFEEMVTDPAGVFSSVCRFLGVDDSVRPPNLGDRINQNVSFRSLALRRLSLRLGGLSGRIIGRVNTRAGDAYPEMSAHIRAKLDEFFEPHNLRLDEMLGVEFERWWRRPDSGRLG